MGVVLLLKRLGVVSFVVLLIGSIAGPASAFTFDRTLKAGDHGPDVKALQVRVAGWFPQTGQTEMGVDGTYGPGTVAAVKAFQDFYGLNADGIAGPTTFAVIAGLEDADGSTAHFNWAEFWQNTNSNCSAKANAYASSFKGGMVSPVRAKKNVKRVMWRLEAMRAKAGDKTIAINSGFRSSPYNDCIGGAGASQHMYGTAADNRMGEVTNRFERDLARQSQFYGIGCYSSLSHNHFDIRIENKDYPGAQFWWWPDQDEQGHDLADDGKPCFGEADTKTKTVGSAMLLPSDHLLRSFASTPEWYEGLGD
jgi:peptidoglycan hydrolase-like protein with peptidoglycan-binding domain